MFSVIKRWWHTVTHWFKPNGAGVHQPTPMPAPAPAVAPAQPGLNRNARRRLDAMRRKYERNRLKHDVWVQPGGPAPVHYPHATPTPTPVAQTELPPPPARPLDDNERLIVDEWMEGDGKEKVLYEENEFWGTFNFRDTILSQLERYWVYIERMRKYDPDAYAFYKKLGATLLPYAATHTNMKHKPLRKITGEQLEEYKKEITLTPWWREHWPAFGCVCQGINPHDEAAERTVWKGHMWTPKFLYITRYQKAPWSVQPVRGGKFYLMTVWFDRPDHPKSKHTKWGVPQTFPIWCSDDGKVIRALKTRETSNGQIRAEHDWRIPHTYTEWAKQWGLTAQLHLTHMFCCATEEIERSYYAMCRVAVTKGEATAVFGIEPQRVPYFFRDRDVTLTAEGRKQRVFHSVRPHMRNGVAVPLQFRGLKSFDWAGYHVDITVPGLDHFILGEVNVAAISMPPRYMRKRKGYLREAEFANYLKEKLKVGFGAYHR